MSQIVPGMTVAEFDAFLAAQDAEGRWELVDGRIVAMSNPNERHE